MKSMFSLMATGLFFALAGLVGAADASATKRIVIIGDSTVCDYPANTPNRGWGQFIQGYCRDNVKVMNHAKSGRSSKSFITEGLWDKALAEKPDFVLIQFGHNDSHAKTEPKATDAATDFKDYLRKYVEETRKQGGVPVFVTPMQRRTFKADGTLEDILLPYANAMKEVAKEKNVGLVDLHTASGKLYLKLGETGSKELANNAEDRTHFGEKGAKAMTELVMKELATAEPKLKPLLKD